MSNVVRPAAIIGAFCFVVLYTLLFSDAAGAQWRPIPLDVADVQTPVSLSQQVVSFRDPSRQLTLEGVKDPAVAAQFTPMGTKPIDFGVTSDALWSTFSLSNTGVQTKTLVLRLMLPSAASVDFYELLGGGSAPRMFRTGALLPYSSRPLPERSFAFPLDVAPGAIQRYYLRVNSDFSLRLPLMLWPEADYGRAVAQEDFAWNLVVSTVLLFSLYSLLVALVIRDRDFLLLAIASSMNILTIYFTNGFAAQWLGDWAIWYPQWGIVMIFLSTISYTALMTSFLDLRRRTYWAYRILLGISVLSAVAMLIGLALDPRIGYAILLACVPVLLLVILVVAAIGVHQRYRPACYSLGAILFMIVLGVLKSTAFLGLAPWALRLSASVPIGDLVLIVVVFLALAERINTARSDLQQANSALMASEQRLLQYLDALPLAVQVYSPKLELRFSNKTAKRGDSWLEQFGGAQHGFREALKHELFRVFGSSSAYPSENIPLLRAARGQRAHVDDIVLTLPDSEHVVEVWGEPLTDNAGNLTTVLIAYQDITERRTIEQELASYREQLEQRVAQRTAELATVNAVLQTRVAELTAINHMTSALSHSLDQETVLETIVEQLRHITEYEGVTISLVEDNNLVIVRAEGSSSPHLGLSTPFDGTSAAIQVLRTGKPLLVQDTGGEYNGLAPWLQTPSIRSWLGAPMIAGGRVVGVLNLHSTIPGAFNPSQIDLLMTIAGQAAISITNACLYQQAQASAALSERQRIARDLHDAVTQSIASASLTAEALLRQLPDVEPEAQHSLLLLRKLTKGALAELRALLLEWHPEHLTATPLGHLLRHLAQIFTGRTGVPVQVVTNCSPHYQLVPAVQVAAYRIAQEALNNAAKHAHAENVTINLMVRTDALRLDIVDNGCGFDVQACTAGQFRERLGLAIMDERAAEIGARLTVDSVIGKGTQIVLVWNEEA